MGTVRISETNTSPSTTFIVEGDLLSQSVAGNYSVVRCYLVAINAGNSSSFYAGAGSQSGTIAGVKTFATTSRNPFLPSGYASGATRWRLGPYDVKVPHNADGTRDPIRFGMVLDYSVKETLFSADMPLPTIPRASNPTLSASAVDVGSSLTITTNRASSAFTHTIQLWEYGVGATSPISTVATGVGASVAWTPPLSLASYFPDATSRLFFLRTITYSGSSEVGTADTVFTLRAPASMVPSVSSITVAEQNPNVASIVGKFVQGLSVARLTVNGAGIYGSTVESATATFQSQTVPSGDDLLVTQSGTISITGRVTDSRGRVGSGTANLAALAYKPPSVTAYQARRCSSIGTPLDDGQYLRVDLNAAVASLINSTERNAITIRAFTRVRGTGSWTARNVITQTPLTYNTWFLVSGGDVFSPTASYDVRVEVSDKFNVYVADTVISTAAVALDMSGTNVGVGKIWEQGALDVSGQIFQAGKPVVDSGSLPSAVRNLLTKHVSEATSVGRAYFGTGDTATDNGGTYIGMSPTSGADDAQTQAFWFATAAGSRVAIYKNGDIKIYGGRIDAPHSAWAEAAGTVTVPASGVTTVTFPSGRFNRAPRVLANPVGNSVVGHAHIGNRTATSFEVRFFTYAGAQTSGTIEWFAVQMSEGNASG